MKEGSRPITSMFVYDTLADSDYTTENIEICGNTVNYEITAEDEAAFINEKSWDKNWGWNGFHCLAVGGKNGNTAKKIMFSDNTINAPSVSSINKHLMFYSFKESDTLNSYVLQNNKLEKFTWIRSQMGAEFELKYSNNVDLGGEVLEFDNKSEKNYIIGMDNVGN